MDTRRFWLMVAGAGWLLAWAASVAVFWALEPTGDGFARGLNRVMAFLGWQAIAAMLAPVVWGIGRAWPKGSAVRRLSRVPMGLAVLLGIALGAVVLWARG